MWMVPFTSTPSVPAVAAVSMGVICQAPAFRWLRTRPPPPLPGPSTVGIPSGETSSEPVGAAPKVHVASAAAFVPRVTIWVASSS
jgi:hypothetical protein